MCKEGAKNGDKNQGMVLEPTPMTQVQALEVSNQQLIDEDSDSEGRGCLEEGCLGLRGVFPDIS